MKIFEGCCNDNVLVYLFNMYSSFDINIEVEDFFKVDFYEVDIVFFVNEDLEEDLLFLEVSYVFYDIVKLFGYVFIGCIDLYNEKVRCFVLDLFCDFWFIFVLIFFFIGIVGMVIWVLVS